MFLILRKQTISVKVRLKKYLTTSTMSIMYGYNICLKIYPNPIPIAFGSNRNYLRKKMLLHSDVIGIAFVEHVLCYILSNIG